MILPDRDLDEDVDACSDEHPRVPRLVWGEEGEHSSSDRDRDGVVNKGGHHQGDMRRLGSPAGKPAYNRPSHWFNGVCSRFAPLGSALHDDTRYIFRRLAGQVDWLF